MRKGREKILSGKFCECGCGQETFLITDTQKKLGLIKGMPRKFICGHHPRSGNWYQKVRVSNTATRGVHLVIAENALGKPLPLNSEVHHVNLKREGGPLVICQDHGYHLLLHVRQRSYVATGDPHNRKCTFCKKWDSPLNMVALKNGCNFHHKECKSIHTHFYNLARKRSHYEPPER